MRSEHNQNEEILDLEGWDSVRVLGHRMIDDLLDYLEDLKHCPTWQHLTNG